MEIIKNIPFLDPEDVSQAVMYALATKPHVQVNIKCVLLKINHTNYVLLFMCFFLNLFIGSRANYKTNW